MAGLTLVLAGQALAAQLRMIPAAPLTVAPSYCAGIAPPSQTLPGANSFTYRTIGQRALRIHLFQPADAGRKRPAILLFFGGGFRTGDAASLADSAKILSAHGYVVALADYRILCRDGVTALAGLADAQAADTWLRRNAQTFGVDEKRIALGGSSAGGLLAATIALRAPSKARPAALVLINPVLDLTAGMWAGDQEPAIGKAFSASALPIDRLPPTIIFHGDADEVVPIASSRAFCARAVAAGRSCRLVEYAGMHHSFNDKKKVVPALGVSPFDDTMTKTLDFLAEPDRAAP